MTWIIQILWLIPALPLLAAESIGSLGAERRQLVAHGMSRGIEVRNVVSSGGATE